MRPGGRVGGGRRHRYQHRRGHQHARSPL